MSYVKYVHIIGGNIHFLYYSHILALRQDTNQARKGNPVMSKKQKPNLAVTVSPKATKVFVKPGMQFRPE